MSNIIPPFLCTTPPPVDCIKDNEDDFSSFEDSCTEYDSINELTSETFSQNTNENLKLPEAVNFSLIKNQTFESKVLDENLNDNDTKSDCVLQTENDIASTESTSQEKLCNTINDKLESSQTNPNHLNNDDCQTNIKSDIQIANHAENYLSSDSFSKEVKEEVNIQFTELDNDNFSKDENSISNFQTVNTTNNVNDVFPSLKFDSVNKIESCTPAELETNESNSTKDVLEFDDFQFNNMSIVDQVNKYEGDNLNTEENESTIEGECDTVVIYDSIHGLEISNSPESFEKENADIFTSDDENIDEFNGFETFTDDQIPQNSDNEVIQKPSDKIADIETNNLFEADFSQFNTSQNYKYPSENHTIQDLNDEKTLQNYVEKNTESIKKLEIVETNSRKNECDVDNEDFGEFSGFQNSKVGVTEEVNLQDKIKNIINIMFPLTMNECLTPDASKNDQENRDSINKLSFDLLKEVDLAHALNFQWANSNTKHSLIKSLGIDSRNILYGEKWNSNIPRFAANLGLSPLEPLKPTKITETQSVTSLTDKTSDNKTKSKDVPAVEFDWNTSGLINPLDGVKEDLQEKKVDTIHSTEFDCDYQSINEQQTNKSSIENIKTCDTITNVSTNTSNNITNLSLSATENITLQNIDDYQFYYSHENTTLNNPIEDNTHQHKIISSYVLPLKETHIFTSDKSKNVTNKEIIQNDDECTIDFDYKMAAAGMIINENVVKKEYRDIEYDPKKLKTNINDENYNTDNNMQIYSPQATNTSQFNVKGININDKNVEKLDYEKSQLPKTNSNNFINNLELSTKITSSSSSFSSNVTANILNSKLSSNVEENLVVPSNYKTMFSDNLNNCPNTAKTVITNQKEEIEDDFTDFQCAVPQSSVSAQAPIVFSIADNGKTGLKSTRKTNQNELRPSNIGEMILSPAVLLPQVIEIDKRDQNAKVNWSESGLDFQELKQLETVFNESNSTHSRSNLSSKNDDDDWSDFISVQMPPSTNKKVSTSPHSSTSQRTVLSSLQSQHDDEWSDFMYSTPSISNSSISYVSNDFSNLNNITTPSKSWQQSDLSTNNWISGQLLTSSKTMSVPISQHYQGKYNIDDKNPFHQNGFPMPVSNNFDQKISSYQNNLHVNNTDSNLTKQQLHQFNENAQSSLFPSITFVTPKTVSLSSNKLPGILKK